MADGYMIDTKMKRITNEAFVKKAKALAPRLAVKTVLPAAVVDIGRDEDGKAAAVLVAEGNLTEDFPLGKGERLCLDFGNHYVGHVTLKFRSVGSPQDAPAYIRLKFGEMPGEMAENSEDYDGWIGRGWIQEEYLHLDALPEQVALPRRYAFRYLEILAVDTSRKWKLVVEQAVLEAVSAVLDEEVKPLQTEDALLKAIDRVSLWTLQNCMQTVFEDGPKRDRRLWLGDLRLQALANYKTFRYDTLVKRCLYLFAGQTRDDGRISACLFLEPEYIVDDTFFFDYSLFFAAALYDYYQASKDLETAEELWDSAFRQLELAGREFDDSHLLKCQEGFKCFIDWKDGLDKQAAAQAVYVYCAVRAEKLARILGKEAAGDWLEEEIKNKKAAAVKYLWDASAGLFVSGPDRQISYASQVWMILAEVAPAGEAAGILKRLLEARPEMDMVTPYMNHHFVEALWMAGEQEQAVEYIKYYWGGMIKEGADTFWELYRPGNPRESPYGSCMVNSYCHAWSCTPAYLLRR